MNGIKNLVGFLVLVLIACTFGVGAQEWALSTDLALYSAYVWRGQVGNDEPVFQPSVTLGLGSFAINLWGSLDLTDRVGTEGEFNEIDLTASYGKELGPVSWEIGLIRYIFPNGGGDTGELFASLALDSVVEPSVTVYYDYDEAKGTYVELALGRDFRVSEETTLAAEIATGWASEDSNEWYYEVRDAAFDDGRASLSLGHQLSEVVSLSAGLHYVWMWDSQIRSAAGNLFGEEDLLFGGVVLSIDF